MAPGAGGDRRARGRDPVGALAPRPSRVACSRSATRSPSPRTSRLLRSGVELVGVDLARARRRGHGAVAADVRALPLRGRRVRPGAARLDARARRAPTTPATGSTAEDDPDVARRRAARARSRPAARRTAARHRPARRAGRPRLVPAGRRRGLERALLVRGPVRRGAGGVRARRGGLARGSRLPGRRASATESAGPPPPPSSAPSSRPGRLRRLVTPDGLART